MPLNLYLLLGLESLKIIVEESFYEEARRIEHVLLQKHLNLNIWGFLRELN